MVAWTDNEHAQPPGQQTNTQENASRHQRGFEPVAAFREARARFTIRPYPAPESALRYGRNIQPAVDVSNLHLPPDRYILIKPVSHRCPSKHQRRDVEIYVDTARDKIAARRFGAARSPPNICFPPPSPRLFMALIRKLRPFMFDQQR